MKHIQDETLNYYARLAGLFYLLVIFGATFSQGYIRSVLVVRDDAITTANNIMASEGLFRLGLVGDLIAFCSDLVVAVLFYMLLKSVNKPLALMASVFRVVMAAILGLNLVNHYIPLIFLAGGEYLSAFSTEQLYGLATVFLKAHTAGYLVGLTFFGWHCLILGYLLFKSGYIPKIFGVLMVAASVGYLLLGFLSFSIGSLPSPVVMILMAPAPIAEWSLCIWLLFKGVNKTSLPNFTQA